MSIPSRAATFVATLEALGLEWTVNGDGIACLTGQISNRRLARLNDLARAIGCEAVRAEFLRRDRQVERAIAGIFESEPEPRSVER